MGIPGEVALAICMLDVKPYEIIRDVMLVKALVHRLHIFLVIIIPAALVIAQTGEGREGLGAYRVKNKKQYF